MTDAVVWLVNQASCKQIAEHLLVCDAEFAPRLSERVEIDAYAEKIATHAVRLEAWVSHILVGLVAIYCNDADRQTAYITSVSVAKNWMARGIGSVLVRRAIDQAIAAGMRRIRLEVGKDSRAAIALYTKLGFSKLDSQGAVLGMELDLKEVNR